ncbi:MAG: trypsin-like peptidase protein [Sediminibacterium sp.]|nr:trypsin-like peptidase protein [Sediminibacterium sp.]
MDDILLLEAIERYLNGDMDAAERDYFETLRKNTPEIDQMVVEHSMFLHQMDIYSVHRNLKLSLQSTHAKLLERGEVNEGGELTTKGKVIQLWNKYKKVTAIAASAGGAIALVISGLMVYFAPVNNSQLEQLSSDMSVVKGTLGYLKEDARNSKNPKKDITFISGGSGFLIDTKGYIVTNAHVLKGSGAVVVNSKGQEFEATIVDIDKEKDLAILKISDANYVPLKGLPYGIRKGSTELGESIFTLGYPRNDIVYGEGYLSARTGLNGDSLSYQISISANPGNSGAPVFNNSGEVIGILSTRQAQAQGVAFAIKSKNIYRMVEDLQENDTTFKNIKISNRSSLKGVERKQQISKVEDCVFYVKAYNNQ